MPKATLTYDLSSPEDSYSYKLATKASDLKSCIHDIHSMIRSMDKYGHLLTEELRNSKEAREVVSLIREKINEILTEHNIDPYE